MRKRNRACEECHRLKIKCDVATSPRSACERCVRNDVECVPSAPRLQRNRISQLEAQITELQTALLGQRNQSSDTTPSRSPGSLLQDKKSSVLSFLDTCIPVPQQRLLLDCFKSQISMVWPVVCLIKDLDQTRIESPILLLSILTFSCTQDMQGTKLEMHDGLVREMMRVLGDQVINKGQRSLELVQALLVTAFWNKPTRKDQQASCYQLVQLAVDMAVDLGIAGSLWQPSPAAYFARLEDVTSLDARRTWLACYVALSTSSIDMRRPTTVPWDNHHEECLFRLEQAGGASDLLLCQIVRITQLMQEISSQLHLFHLGTWVDGNDYKTHLTIESLKIRIDVWAAQIPHDLATSPILKVLRHVAMVRLYEVLLHTPTNRSSFAAPFIPGRIPVRDFPAPENMIPPLKTALNALVRHCHVVVDTVTDMDPAIVLALPTFSFAPIVLYSLYILVTAMAASTGPRNTYGQCVTKDSFKIEHCASKLRTLTSGMKLLDHTMSCWTTRFLDATGWLEQWYHDYNTIVQRYETSLHVSLGD